MPDPEVPRSRSANLLDENSQVRGDDSVLGTHRTGGLTVAAAQTFQQPRSSTAERLRAQAEGRHYSTFSLYPPQELSASIATFLARLPGPEVSWVDEHLLVVAGASRPGQAEPDGPASPASQPVKDHAPRSAPGASEAPNRHPGGRAQIG